MTPTNKKATPEQKQMFDGVMLNARKMIYDDTGVKTVVDKVSQSENGPAAGIGHTAAMILKSIKGGLEQQGRTIPPEVMLGALKETVGDVTDVAVAAKVLPEEQKIPTAQEAMRMGARFLSQKPPQQAQEGQAAPQQAAPPPMPTPGQAPVDGLIKQATGAL